MHTPLKHHLLELHKHHLIEQVAFAQEYGADGFGASKAQFPHSAPDVFAVTAMCFDYAQSALDATQTDLPHLLWEDRLAPSTEHVASVAAMPWIALVKEVERAQTSFTQHLRATDEALLHSAPPSTARSSAPVFLPYLPINAYMYQSPVPFAEPDDWTVAARLGYLTTAQPALLRAWYVWNCGKPDLALRMFACACDRVESYDEFRGLAMRMRYTLAHMYRCAKRYLEAVEALRRLIVLNVVDR